MVTKRFTKKGIMEYWLCSTGWFDDRQYFKMQKEWKKLAHGAVSFLKR
jgi:hypothetical protein